MWRALLFIFVVGYSTGSFAGQVLVNPVNTRSSASIASGPAPSGVTDIDGARAMLASWTPEGTGCVVGYPSYKWPAPNILSVGEDATTVTLRRTCSAGEWVQTVWTKRLTQCSDGIDNDGDGAVDMADRGCSSPEDDNEADEEQCNANAGDLLELPEGIPVGQQTACSGACVVTPYAGMQITANSSTKTGVIMYGIVKDPPQWCDDSAAPDPVENYSHRCKTSQAEKVCEDDPNRKLEESPGDDDAVPPVLPSQVDIEETAQNGCAKYSGSSSVLCQSDTEKAPQEPSGAKIQPDANIAISPYSWAGGYTCIPSSSGQTSNRCTPGQFGGNYSYYNQQTINNYGCQPVNGVYICTQGPGCGAGTTVRNGQCIGTPNCGPGTRNQNGMCVSDGEDGGEGECDPSTEQCDDDGEFSEPGGDYEFKDYGDDVTAAQTELEQQINTVKAEAAQLLGTVTTGGGSLPCWTHQVLGSEFSLCVAEYQSQLSVVRPALMLIAAVAAAFIILAGRS